MAKVVLTKWRIAFPDIFRAKVFGADANAKPSYSALLIADPATQAAEIEKVKAAIREVATAQWKDKAAQMLQVLSGKQDLCLRSGDLKPEYDGFAGMMYLSTRRREADGPPLVVDQRRNPVSESSGVIYSGCYVNAIIDIWPQDNNWGKRINAQLQGVQFAGDGERFSGGGTAKPEEFDVLEDAGNANDLAGLGF